MKLRTARLAALVAVSLSALAARAFLARAGLQFDRLAGAPSPNETVNVPFGYLASGLTAGGMNPSGCVVLRFVEQGCNYCASGRSVWDRLMGTLAPLGCGPLGIAPSRRAALPASVFGYGGEEQLILVPMDWVRHYHPSIAPSVIIVGRGGSVIWYRVGALQEGDIVRALKSVRRYLR